MADEVGAHHERCDQVTRRDWYCHQCRVFMFSSSDTGVCTPDDMIEHQKVPIVLTTGNIRRVVCSKACACEAIESTEEAALRAGYPLW